MAGTRRAYYWRPTQVPTFPVEVDWSHPLAQASLGCWVPGISQSRDFGGANISIPTGSPVVGGTSRGPSITLNGTTQYLKTTRNLGNGTIFQNMTHFCVIQTTTNTQVIYGINAAQDGTGGTTEKDLTITPTGYVNFYVYAGAPLNATDTHVVVTDGRPHTILATCSFNGTTTSISISVDGNSPVQNSIAGTPYSSYTTSYLIIGANNKNASSTVFTLPTQSYFAGNILLAGSTSRAIPIGFSGEFNAEPFAMLRPKIRRTYAVISAPAGGFKPYFVRPSAGIIGGGLRS